MKIAKDTLMEAQQRQSTYANQHRCHLEFKVGDRVLLSTRHINNPVDKQRPTRKLSPKFIGSYTVAAVISKTAYKLDLPVEFRIHPVFHISLLKPYKATDEFNRDVLPPPVFIPETNQEEYEVEFILDK